jgi:hypothetical protein
VELLAYCNAHCTQLVRHLGQCAKEVELVLPVEVVRGGFGVEGREECDVAETREDGGAEVF